MLLEICQAICLKKQYFTELENYIEIYILLSALVAMICKKHILLHNDPLAQYVRGFIALGVSFGGEFRNKYIYFIFPIGLEMIFIIGRYPMRSGIFNTMYYTIVKKVLKYAMAMFILVVGYACSFMIVNYGPDSKSFRSPFKSIINTLTMTLGEYGFVQMYQDFKDDNDVDRSFAIILLGKEYEKY